MKMNLKAILPKGVILTGKELVTSLHEGAKKNGNATLSDGVLWSNIEGGDIINIDKAHNTLGLIVPSTNGRNKFNNERLTKNTVGTLHRTFIGSDITVMPCKATFLAKNGVITYDDNLLITIELDREIFADDILMLEDIAGQIKYLLNQEGVSITINDSMAIV
jgi:hypothetical protein